MKRYRKMLVSDLDGTLLFPGHTVHPEEVDTLYRLGEEGVLRVLATGRSWLSTRKTLPEDFPIDYLVFSTGAGIVDWKTDELLVSHNLSVEQVSHVTKVFLEHELDFMVHAPIPDNHRFSFYRTDRPNTDFDMRLTLHWDHGVAHSLDAPAEASELLAIHPGGENHAPYEALQKALPGFSVVRATSPLDGHSLWLEVFSPHVSKSQGAKWLGDRHGVPASEVLAVGNDYNDWDLLRWAGMARIMDNAPEHIRREFTSLPSESRTGVSQAVAQWLAK